MLLNPRITRKYEKNTGYIPRDVSNDAAICLNCPLPDCKYYNCERFKKEKAKLKHNKKST